jgi:hypothetical protein
MVAAARGLRICHVARLSGVCTVFSAASWQQPASTWLTANRHDAIGLASVRRPKEKLGVRPSTGPDESHGR